MKCLSTLLLFLCCFSLLATVHTVDNSANSVAQFTDLQAAIDAASEGDTLLIKGSFVPYVPTDFSGSLDDRSRGIRLNKSLVLIGEGAYGHPGSAEFEDRKPKTSVTRLFMTIGDGTSASGSTIIGLRIWRMVLGDDNGINETISNIELRESAFTDLRFAETGDTLDGLVIKRSGVLIGDGTLFSNLKNFQIINCIVNLTKELLPPEGENRFVNSLIYVEPDGPRTKYGDDGEGNDLFEREWSMQNVEISSSILLNRSDNPRIPDRLVFKSSNIQLSNNIVMGPYENRDLLDASNVDPVISNMSVESNPFVRIPPWESSARDGSETKPIRIRTAIGDFHLKATSVGVDNGTDGTDIGMYGGTEPWIDGPVWRYSNEPSIPTIKSLELTKKVVKPGEGLKVKVKASAKNN